MIVKDACKKLVNDLNDFCTGKVIRDIKYQSFPILDITKICDRNTDIALEAYGRAVIIWEE